MDRDSAYSSEHSSAAAYLYEYSDNYADHRDIEPGDEDYSLDGYHTGDEETEHALTPKRKRKRVDDGTADGAHKPGSGDAAHMKTPPLSPERTRKRETYPTIVASTNTLHQLSKSVDDSVVYSTVSENDLQHSGTSLPPKPSQSPPLSASTPSLPLPPISVSPPAPCTVPYSSFPTNIITQLDAESAKSLLRELLSEDPTLADKISRKLSARHLAPTTDPLPSLSSSPSRSPLAITSTTSTTTSSDLSSRDLERDWNREFQEVLERREETLDSLKRLRTLANDFVFAAETYGRIIISERYLPGEKKTIKPVHIGGVAGGEKFVCQGILFKFCVDTLVGKDRKVWMYGGEAAADEAAMKAAGNELQGLVHVFKCRVQSLSLPLMALIDYLGFRLIAISLVPIGSDTLIYGSNDAGKTVHADNAELNILVKQVAKKLNLKGHWVGGRKLYAPGDIEGHRGHDGRFYLLDFARIFPPEAPPPPPIGGVRSQGDKRTIFYRLLRPELVKRHPVPLSPDAFTNFQRTDPLDKQLNGQVRLATERLYFEIIPTFARSLGATRPHDVADADALPALVNALHREGINIRHLGRVRSHVTDPLYRRLLLTEMCARVLKNTLRGRLRGKMRQVRLPSEEPYRRVVLEFLNRVFGYSAAFWRSAASDVGSLKHSLVAKFTEAALAPAEAESTYDLRLAADGVDMRLLLDRLQRTAHIKLSARVLAELGQPPRGVDTSNGGTRGSPPTSFPEFVEPDLETLGVKVKHMDIVEHTTGVLLALEAERQQGRGAARLFELAEDRFRASVAALPDNAEALYQWGRLLHCKACRYRDLEAFERAEERLRAAVKLEPEFLSARALCAQSLLHQANMLLDRIVASAARGGDNTTAQAGSGDMRGQMLQSALAKYAEALRLDGTLRSHVLAKAHSLFHLLTSASAEAAAATSGSQGPSSSTNGNVLLDNPIKALMNSSSAVSAMWKDWLIQVILAIVELVLEAKPGYSSARRLRGQALVHWGRMALDTLNLRDSNSNAWTVLRTAGDRYARGLADYPDHLADLSTLISFSSASGGEDGGGFVMFFCLAQSIAVLQPAVQKRLAELERLNLSGCCALPLPILQALFQQTGSERITSLDLSRCWQLTDDAAIVLCRHMPNLKSLSLSYCYKLSNVVLSHLATLTALEVLHLAGLSNLTDGVITAIARSCTTLQELNIGQESAGSQVGITDRSIMELAKNCCKLKVLNLRCVDQVSDTSAIMLAKHCLELTVLNLERSPPAQRYSYTPSIPSRNMVGITDSGAIALLKGLPRLEELDLAYCEKLTDKTLLTVVKLLPGLALRSLRIAGCEQASSRARMKVREATRHMSFLLYET